MKKTNDINIEEVQDILEFPIVSGEKTSQTRGKKADSEESILTDAEFLKILLKVKKGNFTQRFPTDQNGIKRSICDTLNEIIDLNERMVFEFQKV
ncbi:hypothetical protein D3C80_1926520 [compost metagenome]